MYARIAVAVRHIDLAIFRLSAVGAAVELAAAHERCAAIRRRDLQQLLAGKAVFRDPVGALVGEPQPIALPHRQAVRPHEIALTPGTEMRARAIEHMHRHFGAREHIDIVVPIDADVANVAVRKYAARLPPVRLRLIAKGGHEAAAGAGKPFTLIRCSSRRRPSSSEYSIGVAVWISG